MQELKTLNAALKQKLEEAQKNLESNVQMIAWLNKQLNEKPGIGGSVLPPPSSLGKLVTPVGSGPTKPPIASITASFKPSFSSVEQLSSVASGSSIERSPYRNIGASSGNLTNTPVSASSSISNSFVQHTASASVQKGTQAFEYPTRTTVTNENLSSNLPLAQPTFVSKYAQQLYQQ